MYTIDAARCFASRNRWLRGCNLYTVRSVRRSRSERGSAKSGGMEYCNSNLESDSARYTPEHLRILINRESADFNILTMPYTLSVSSLSASPKVGFSKYRNSTRTFGFEADR